MSRLPSFRGFLLAGVFCAGASLVSALAAETAPKSDAVPDSRRRDGLDDDQFQRHRLCRSAIRPEPVTNDPKYPHVAIFSPGRKPSA